MLQDEFSVRNRNPQNSNKMKFAEMWVSPTKVSFITLTVIDHGRCCTVGWGQTTGAYTVTGLCGETSSRVQEQSPRSWVREQSLLPSPPEAESPLAFESNSGALSSYFVSCSVTSINHAGFPRVLKRPAKFWKMKKEKSGPEKFWNWALVLKESWKSVDIWSQWCWKIS